MKTLTLAVVGAFALVALLAGCSSRDDSAGGDNNIDDQLYAEDDSDPGDDASHDAALPELALDSPAKSDTTNIEEVEFRVQREIRLKQQQNARYATQAERLAEQFRARASNSDDPDSQSQFNAIAAYWKTEADRNRQ